jgi:glutathione S-transferase
VTALPRLITIPVSHYCEKARWALERAGLAYVEEGHVPMLHWRATARHRARTVPILLTGDAVLRSSAEIVRWADARTPAGARLYPEGTQLRREVEELEAHFDGKLGPATRRWAYGYVLPDRKLAVELLGASVPGKERALLAAGWPFIARLMRRGMKVTPEGVARSFERMQATFAEVSRRIGAGRRYLVGDRFSAADLTFAALAVPAVAPPQYGFAQAIEALPTAMRREVEALRATPAGAFALRLYREERPRIGARAVTIEA